MHYVKEKHKLSTNCCAGEHSSPYSSSSHPRLSGFVLFGVRTIQVRIALEVRL